MSGSTFKHEIILLTLYKIGTLILEVTNEETLSIINIKFSAQTN